MPNPRLSLVPDPARDQEVDQTLVVVGSDLDAALGATAWAGLVPALRSLGFTGAANRVVRVPDVEGGPAIAVVGAGTAPGAAAYREAAGAGILSLTNVSRVALVAPGAGDEHAQALLEGAGLGGYAFAGYKSRGATTRASAVVLAESGADASAAERAQAIADGVALVKDLINTPADALGPQDLADRAREAVADLPVEVEVLDEAALAEGGYGGILGVGRGSARPPRFVTLAYRPAEASARIAIVGKGITFDTGGLSLKPPSSMVGMKYDMAGAASVVGAVQAIARLGLPIAVTGYLCIAENMPSGSATRPGDVLTMLDGTSVEVLNTDAEGRLVLADGLVAASREHPDLIIDIATLTGAILTALGSRYSGVMGDDDAVASFLESAGAAGEDAWPLPLPAHMRDELDSPIADMVNAKIGDPAGGSLFAGLFLERFVGAPADAEDGSDARIPWVHLDIAGSGTNKSGPWGYTDKGPTAVLVRSLVEHARRLADASAEGAA